MIPGVSLAEPFTECMICGVILACGLTAIIFPTRWIMCVYIFAAHCSLWFTFDCILQFSIDGDLFRNNSVFKLMAVWFVREWLTVYILVRSLWNLTTITWAGGEFRVNTG